MNLDTPRTNLSPDEKSLIAAALAGDAARIRALLAMGVAVDARDSESYPLGPEWSLTALMCGAAKGHLDVVRALLSSGANPNAASEAHKEDGGGGSTALHHALLGGHIAVAEALLDAGADSNAIGRYGRTPLTTAVSQMNLAAVQLMLSRGADTKVKTRRKDVAPPLYVAASALTSTSSMVLRDGKFVMQIEVVWARRQEVLGIFRLLLNAGADPNAPDPGGGTPLATLAFCDLMPDGLRFPILELLLNAGANPNQADKDGFTAIKAAQVRKNNRVMELLTKAAAALPPKPAPPSSMAKARAKDAKE
jgi:hypothetical protein